MENRVTEFFKQKGFDLEAVFTGEDTSTVAKAAAVLGVEEGMIAKSLAFRLKDGTPIVLVVCGTGRIDNHKFKETFHVKARMLKADEVEKYTNHAVGGVCPFAVPEETPVYLDVSLKRFPWISPTCGSANSAIKLSNEELQALVPGARWVDVCKI